MDSLYIIPTLSIYQNGSIRLSINRFENSTFISLFVHFRHANIATINNKKQAKQLEALASSP